ncbi:hypothetical protein BT69DRAFT_744319 [Atractiella rhizophila]|nr:hypothetical protein BT69DRAFT_744319 [Atractiella rhizophila]
MEALSAFEDRLRNDIHAYPLPHWVQVGNKLVQLGVEAAAKGGPEDQEQAFLSIAKAIRLRDALKARPDARTNQQDYAAFCHNIDRLQVTYDKLLAARRHRAQFNIPSSSSKDTARPYSQSFSLRARKDTFSPPAQSQRRYSTITPTTHAYANARRDYPGYRPLPRPPRISSSRPPRETPSSSPEEGKRRLLLTNPDPPPLPIPARPPNSSRQQQPQLPRNNTMPLPFSRRYASESSSASHSATTHQQTPHPQQYPHPTSPYQAPLLQHHHSEPLGVYSDPSQPTGFYYLPQEDLSTHPPPNGLGQSPTPFLPPLPGSFPSRQRTPTAPTTSQVTRPPLPPKPPSMSMSQQQPSTTASDSSPEEVPPLLSPPPDSPPSLRAAPPTHGPARPPRLHARIDSGESVDDATLAGYATLGSPEEEVKGGRLGPSPPPVQGQGRKGTDVGRKESGGGAATPNMREWMTFVGEGMSDSEAGHGLLAKDKGKGRAKDEDLTGEDVRIITSERSQYSLGGMSACGLASMNAAREILTRKLGGNEIDGPLLDGILDICAFWTSEKHLDIDMIHSSMPLFQRSLVQTEGEEVMTKTDDSFEDILSEMSSSPNTAVIVTRPPEIILLLVPPIPAPPF